MKPQTILLSSILAWSASAAVIDTSAQSENLAIKRADDLECDYDHAPNRNDCQTLLNRIISGQAQHNLQASPRNIQYSSCYVSWSDYVVGSAQELVPYIQRMISSCQSGQDRSGIIKNVSILGQQKKVAICLSNRASGCSN
ncbi:hypothetical protein V8F20_004373 [Naviculisporaceae sp. PSN 640]